MYLKSMQIRVLGFFQLLTDVFSWQQGKRRQGTRGSASASANCAHCCRKIGHPAGLQVDIGLLFVLRFFYNARFFVYNMWLSAKQPYTNLQAGFRPACRFVLFCAEMWLFCGEIWLFGGKIMALLRRDMALLQLDRYFFQASGWPAGLCRALLWRD